MEEKVDETKSWPKTWSGPFIGKSFFFRNQGSYGHRLTAWTSDLEKIKRLFYAALETFPERVSVLLKRSEFADNKDDPWQRYYNDDVSLVLVADAIRGNENLIFQESDIQFCLKYQDGPEYIVLDEWGAFFAYSANPSYDEILGFDLFRPEEHLSEYDHFRQHPAASELLFADFVHRLNLIKAARRMLN
jgi:hypothetical protein